MGSRVLMFSVNQYDFPYPVFPLGVAHVEAALRRAGYVTRLVDFNVNVQPLGELVAEFKPDFVGVSLRNIDDALIQRQQTFFDELQHLCVELRTLTSAPIVLGGSGFSIFPEQLLQLSGADYGIQGEGEAQLPALLGALAAGADPRGLSGLVYREGDQVRVNGRLDLVVPDSIAVPDGAEELTAYYLQRSSMLNVQTQRGCALKCCYCTYPLLEGRKYRRRPADQVVEELGALVSRGARYVFVVDSVFNTSPSHVREICEGILGRGLKLQWCCFLRPKGLTDELMQLMARAGLKHVEFGSDSFCDEVLETYGKQLTFGDVLASSEMAHRAGLDYAHFLICGGPGETWQTLETGFENSRRLPNATIMARVGMRVYPGTPLHERMLVERGAAGMPDLLRPHYYVSSEVTEAGVFQRMREVALTMPNWIFEDPPPTYYKMAERLRARGVVGPLWAYFAMMQRLGGGLPGAARA